tara:strand:+ start:60 stop:338 length:279 start_codon:yes stop_codon:yes gene_type:complete
MKESKDSLDINNCIIIHDVKQIQKEPAEEKIKTLRGLSKKIRKEKLLEGSQSSIYTKLYRAQQGFSKEPTDLIDVILKVLEVDRDQLISKEQ